ncbi:MAG: hypothetical protein JNL30_15230 [Rubrivivax sp.]|nr:hypothetical protein [Rubrivivax sp.]
MKGDSGASGVGGEHRCGARVGTVGLRCRWPAVAALATALAAGMGWWWWPAPHEGVRLHAGAQAFPWARTPVVGEPARAASAPSVSAAAPEGQRTGSPTGPVAFELCGLGRIVVPSDAARPASSPAAAASASATAAAPLGQLPAPVGRFALQDAQDRLVQVLAVGDARQRVAARLLRQPGDEDPGALAAWASGLVADALASRDAQAMRWAGAACPFVDDEVGCRRRLLRARTQADPANALHWLEWLGDEPEAADAVWAGLVRAQHWREQPLGLAGVLMRTVAPDVPGYVQATMAVEAMAHDVAFPAPPLAPVLERCAAQAGAAAAPGCERFARLLVERGDSVQALMLGRELGERIGWPAEQLQQLEHEVQALQRQEVHWAVDAQRPLGCETVQGQGGHIAAVEREGELAVLRRNRAAGPGPR